VDELTSSEVVAARRALTFFVLVLCGAVFIMRLRRRGTVTKMLLRSNSAEYKEQTQEEEPTARPACHLHGEDVVEFVLGKSKARTN
jgi:hypothetical protein